MLFTDNQLEILALFFSQPEAELHMSELGRVLEKKPGVFQRGLNKLEAEGILQSRARGNQRLISLNKNYPFLSEIRSIVEKTAGIVPQLSALVRHADGVVLAFIFGSFVQNKMRADSDIDLVIVCPAAIQGKVLKEISGLEEKVLREINPKFYTSTTFSNKRRGRDPFLGEVLSNKVIMLKGNL